MNAVFLGSASANFYAFAGYRFKYPASVMTRIQLLCNKVCIFRRSL